MLIGMEAWAEFVHRKVSEEFSDLQDQTMRFLTQRAPSRRSEWFLSHTERLQVREKWAN